MSNRSVEAWKAWEQAQSKFDYYFLGVIAAIFAYLSNNYIPEKIDLSQNTFELIAIILLGLSFLLGMKRLEDGITIRTLILKQAEARDELNAANKIQQSGGAIDLESGRKITSEEAFNKAAVTKTSIEALQKQFNKKSRKVYLLFRARNWTFIAAFLCLIASKIIGVLNV
mgnify:CR=1 FL=1